MDRKELSGKDLLLCFLYSPGIKDEYNEPIIGRTKLTKMMYLFEKEIYSRFFNKNLDIKLPNFNAYYFGPFSRELFEDLAFFQSIGMVYAEETKIPLSSADKVENDAVFDENYNEFELSYQLSENGTRYVKEKLWGNFTSNQKEKLREFKRQINKVSLDTLLRYVYNKYPEDAKRSLIAGKYLNIGEK